MRVSVWQFDLPWWYGTAPCIIVIMCNYDSADWDLGVYRTSGRNNGGRVLLHQRPAQSPGAAASMMVATYYSGYES